MLQTDTQKKIIALLKKHYPDLVADDLRFDLIVDDDRAIYRVSAPCMQNHIFKTIGRQRKSETEFVDEYKKLRLFRRDSAPGINMPFALGLIDGHGILMTECPGDTLKALYFNSIYNLFARESVSRAIGDCASLLVDIHSLSQQQENYTVVRQNRQDNLARMLDSIRIQPRVQAHVAVLNQAEEQFIRINAGISDIEVCQLHGNFALRNLLWDGQVVSTIDLEDSRRDTIYFDIALLIAELLNKNIYPASRAYNARLIEIFSQGYCQRIDIEPRVLGSYVIYHLVWSYYELASRNPRNRLKSIWLDYRRRQLLYEIERQLESIETN